MLLHSTKETNYVCSAKLSKRLPLWSNAKHCAECPPLKNFRSAGLTASKQFGLVDGDAAVYFDFWSDRHEKLRSYAAVRQAMHDVNGPFNSSCSESRKTNAYDLAGECMFPFQLWIFFRVENKFRLLGVDQLFQASTFARRCRWQ